MNTSEDIVTNLAVSQAGSQVVRWVWRKVRPRRIDPQWLERHEACLLAEEYVIAVKMCSRAKVAEKLVDEFVRRYPYRVNRKRVSWYYLKRWLRTHRYPERWRVRWEGGAQGIVINESGEFMVAGAFVRGKKDALYEVIA